VAPARVPSKAFSWPGFLITVAALGVAPVFAAADLGIGYLPFLLLRGWMIGFALYGLILSSQAGGFRRVWRVPYVALGVVFAFVWGLEVEYWAAIDWGFAAAILASALFLRTEPAVQQSA
jgi:hypothetical protein